MKLLASRRPETLWCSNNRKGSSNRWSYPPAVETAPHDHGGADGPATLRGMARWGVTLDIDPTTTPRLRGDAWMPPFRMNSFDVVILDPPYLGINEHMKSALIAGRRSGARARLLVSYAVGRAGFGDAPRAVLVGARRDNCSCRCLIEWRVPGKTSRSDGMSRPELLRSSTAVAERQRGPAPGGLGA